MYITSKIHKQAQKQNKIEAPKTTRYYIIIKINENNSVEKTRWLTIGNWSYCSPRSEVTTPDSEHLDTARGLVFQEQTTYLLPTISLGAKILVS